MRLASSRVYRALGVVLVGLLWVVGHAVSSTEAQESAKTKPMLEKAFPAAAKCKRCHERVYEEWETSPLSRSIHSSTFRASLDEYLKFSGGKDKSLCLRCHTPHINEFPEHTDQFIKQIQSGEPGIDGVACAQCHLIREVDRTSHPPMPKYDLGSKTLYGPYKNAAQNLAHQSQESELFRKSDLCLNCHLSVPSSANLGKSNDLLGSWETSKAVKSGKECQSCHMPEQSGESANGEAKRKVANHSFPGRIGKLRQEAAQVNVETVVKGDKTTVTVKVQSLVPHNLPATHPGWSSVVLEVNVLGKNLKSVFNEKRVYGRRYEDAKGQPTVFDFAAVKVVDDTVLKPDEVRTETFSFPTPKDTKSFDVEVGLSYAPVAGPPTFLQRIEAESPTGAQDAAFQPIPITKQSTNVLVEK
ncbi:MAG: multiheme c-type cytochrome [Nitrospiraceae bacterium]